MEPKSYEIPPLQKPVISEGTMLFLHGKRRCGLTYKKMASTDEYGTGLGNADDVKKAYEEWLKKRTWWDEAKVWIIEAKRIIKHYITFRMGFNTDPLRIHWKLEKRRWWKENEKLGR